jgi:GxxExxY protein
MNPNIIERDLVHSIVGGFYEVYNYFDYGLVESIYCRALKYELEDRGHDVRRESAVPVFYRSRAVGRQRLDLVVDNRLIVEVKATELLPRYVSRQIVSYLRVTPYIVGLVLHFGPEPKFHRFVDTRPKRCCRA